MIVQIDPLGHQGCSYRTCSSDCNGLDFEMLWGQHCLCMTYSSSSYECLYFFFLLSIKSWRERYLLVLDLLAFQEVPGLTLPSDCILVRARFVHTNFCSGYQYVEVKFLSELAIVSMVNSVIVSVYVKPYKHLLIAKLQQIVSVGIQLSFFLMAGLYHLSFNTKYGYPMYMFVYMQSDMTIWSDETMYIKVMLKYL